MEKKNIKKSIISIFAALLIAVVLCSIYFYTTYKNNHTTEKDIDKVMQKMIDEENPDGFASLEEWHEKDFVNAKDVDNLFKTDCKETSYEGNTFIMTYHLDDKEYTEESLEDYFNEFNKEEADILNDISHIKEITVRYVYLNPQGETVNTFEKTFTYE